MIRCLAKLFRPLSPIKSSRVRLSSELRRCRPGAGGSDAAGRPTRASTPISSTPLEQLGPCQGALKDTDFKVRFVDIVRADLRFAGGAKGGLSLVGRESPINCGRTKKAAYPVSFCSTISNRPSPTPCSSRSRGSSAPARPSASPASPPTKAWTTQRPAPRRFPATRRRPNCRSSPTRRGEETRTADRCQRVSTAAAYGSVPNQRRAVHRDT